MRHKKNIKQFYDLLSRQLGNNKIKLGKLHRNTYNISPDLPFFLTTLDFCALMKRTKREMRCSNQCMYSKRLLMICNNRLNFIKKLITLITFQISDPLTVR